MYKDVKEYGIFKIYRANEYEQNLRVMYCRACSGK